MTVIEWAELLSYLVTIIGLPFAIIVFMIERRKERQNDEEALYQKLADEYTHFLRLVLDNADLQLLRPNPTRSAWTEEQQERRLALFGILVALFERAYILVYDERMPPRAQRLWQTWEDYMREWSRREDFRNALAELLEGDDPDFRAYILRIAAEEATRERPKDHPPYEPLQRRS